MPTDLLTDKQPSILNFFCQNWTPSGHQQITGGEQKNSKQNMWVRRELTLTGYKTKFTAVEFTQSPLTACPQYHSTIKYNTPQKST